MNLKHPLEFIPPNRRKQALIAGLVCTAILLVALQVLDIPLKTGDAPLGIVSFELAGSPDQSTRILLSWDNNARLTAAFGLGLDYLFMPAYAFTLALGILMRYHKRDGRIALQWMAAAGWGQILAATFDAMENYALWLQLTGAGDSSMPALAAVRAALKFGLLLFGVAILLKVAPRK